MIEFESKMSERTSKVVVVVGGGGLKSDRRFFFEIRIETVRVAVVHLRAVVVEQELENYEILFDQKEVDTCRYT
jgi:hypothetical protein